MLGSLIGALFFGAFFGFALANPTYTDWIFNRVTHDTAQHFIGWEFFRADSTGAMINGLAYPIGLPITFMDGIPLIALPLKLISGWLPANFQYFGLWALICYILQGGIAAVLVRKIWQKIYVDNQLPARLSKNGKSVSEETRNDGLDERRRKFDWKRLLFVSAGALIFILSPIMIARTLYHPALAAQWLVLLGILLIWNAPKFKCWWKFVVIWSATLVGAVLIHPYFLPMLGAMMLVAALRNVAKFDLKIVTKTLMQIAIPVVLAGIVFWVIGGFALGSGAEIRDLEDKGFNLLSFMVSGGYSITPSIPPRSYSPESLMWFGLGVWAMIISAVILWRGRYKKSFQGFRAKFVANKTRNILIAIVAFGLFIFAVGPRVDFGPITLFQYPVPDKIYELWSAFRAAAREAWPFYYAAILAIIYWFALVISNRKFKKITKKNVVAVIAISLAVISLIQFIDIWWSPAVTVRREGFAEIQNVSQPQFIAPEISDLITTQKHMIILDSGFRGDHSGFYELAQAALKNELTMNIGFFARVPEQIFAEQKIWRERIQCVHDHSLFEENIFVTTDDELAYNINFNPESSCLSMRVVKRDRFYFITKGAE